MGDGQMLRSQLPAEIIIRYSRFDSCLWPLFKTFGANRCYMASHFVVACHV